MKIIFTALKYRRILHGHVFVMTRSVQPHQEKNLFVAYAKNQGADQYTRSFIGAFAVRYRFSYLINT